MHHEKCHVLSALSSKSCFHTLRSAVEGHPCLPEAAELGSSALQEVLRFGTREMSLRIGSLAFLSPLKHLTFTFKGSMFLLRPRSSQGTDHAILQTASLQRSSFRTCLRQRSPFALLFTRLQRWCGEAAVHVATHASSSFDIVPAAFTTTWSPRRSADRICFIETTTKLETFRDIGQSVKIAYTTCSACISVHSSICTHTHVR